MKRLTAVALLAACLFIPSQLAAQDRAPELRLFVSGAAHLNVSEDVEWWSEGRILERFEIGAGALVAPGLTLVGEFSTVSKSESVLASSFTTLDVRTAGARARYAFDLSDWVRPYLSAGASVVLASMTLDTLSTTLDANDTGFGFDVAAGVEVQTQGRFSVGAYHDFGFAYRTPLRFDAAPNRSDGPQQGVDLGEVTLHGFQWRAGLFVGYRL